MDALSVVKAAVLQKILGVSYRRLAFHLIDSTCCRRFMGLGPFDTAWGKSCLQDNISRISPRSFEAVNRVLMNLARQQGVEAGTKMRFDRTFVEADIHQPRDSSLLDDLVRVICRTVKKAELPKSLRCRDRRKVAKRLAFKISNAKNQKQRKSLYRKLFKPVPGLVHRGSSNRQASWPKASEAETRTHALAESYARGH
jgi:IS5 family transposase